MLTADTFSSILFLGAMAIFIFGIQMSQSGLQLATGDRLRQIMASVTQNRFAGLLVGLGITVILQSSSASTAMLAGFAGSGLLNLTQSLGVILGAGIGTTLVVLLLSIKKISEFALLMIIVGLILQMVTRTKKARHLGTVLLGFGFVFFGMYLLTRATLPLRDVPIIQEIFALVTAQPTAAFILALIFTSLVQNSATTIGITIAMAFSGLLDLRSALPIILGANVGICASTIIASLATNVHGRRVALAHTLLKVSGAVTVMFFLNPFAALISSLFAFLPATGWGMGGTIALAHLVFNVLLSVVFLPFVPQIAWMVEKLMPEPPKSDKAVFKARYLEPSSIATPALAFANARREVQRMADLVYEMVWDTIEVFKNNDMELLADLEKRDDKVDLLEKEIKFYLSKVSQETLTDEQAQIQMRLVSITIDLEEVGDVINKNLMELASKKIRKMRRFSEEGWGEIVDFHGKVLENFHLMMSYLATEDEEVAREVMRHEKNLENIEQEYRQEHLHRLQQGLKETFETSSIHLDILSSLRRINTIVTKIVRVFM